MGICDCRSSVIESPTLCDVFAYGNISEFCKYVKICMVVSKQQFFVPPQNVKMRQMSKNF
jgi:hypothetical protein